MSYHQQYLAFSKYNRLMNEKLYSAATKLTAEQLNQDRQAFFGSIHGTLEHIFIADILWLSRFKKIPELQTLLEQLSEFPSPQQLNQRLYNDFDQLWHKRQQLDLIIEKVVKQISPAALEQTFSYVNLSGKTIENHLWIFLSHFFNHQTHHRGQATTLLAQCAIDIGVTDFHLVI